MEWLYLDGMQLYRSLGRVGNLTSWLWSCVENNIADLELCLLVVIISYIAQLDTLSGCLYASFYLYTFLVLRWSVVDLSEGSGHGFENSNILPGPHGKFQDLLMLPWDHDSALLPLKICHQCSSLPPCQEAQPMSSHHKRSLESDKGTGKAADRAASCSGEEVDDDIRLSDNQTGIQSSWFETTAADPDLCINTVAPQERATLHEKPLSHGFGDSSMSPVSVLAAPLFTTSSMSSMSEDLPSQGVEEPPQPLPYAEEPLTPCPSLEDPLELGSWGSVASGLLGANDSLWSLASLTTPGPPQAAALPSMGDVLAHEKWRGFFARNSLKDYQGSGAAVKAHFVLKPACEWGARGRFARSTCPGAVQAVPSEVVSSNPAKLSTLDGMPAFVIPDGLYLTIKHDNIVDVSLIHGEDGQTWIIEEALEFDLFDYIHRQKQGRLHLKDVLYVAMNVCSAIAVFHQHGCAHGLVKPGNVMLTRRGAVKLKRPGCRRAGQVESSADSVYQPPESRKSIYSTIKHLSFNGRTTDWPCAAPTATYWRGSLSPCLLTTSPARHLDGQQVPRPVLRRQSTDGVIHRSNISPFDVADARPPKPSDDVYALCVLLVEMLVGREAWRIVWKCEGDIGETLLAVVADKLAAGDDVEEEPQPWQDQLMELLGLGLSANAAERPASEAFLKELEAFMRSCVA